MPLGMHQMQVTPNMAKVKEECIGFSLIQFKDLSLDTLKHIKSRGQP